MATNSDDFANFSFTPPRSIGRLRSFSRSYRRYHAPTTGLSAAKKFGSNTSLTSYGSTQDLTLESTRQMDLSEDAKSHKISAEIMKHRLYESVVTSPRRRRFSHRSDYWSGEGGYYGMARMAQSLPVTPAMTPAVTPGQSQNTSPAHSPRGSRQFLFGYWSPRGGATQEEDTMQVEEPTGAKGLASILKPHPKYIAAHRSHHHQHHQRDTLATRSLGGEVGEEPMQTDEPDGGRMTLSFPPPEHQPFINRLNAGDRDSWFHRYGKAAPHTLHPPPNPQFGVAKEEDEPGVSSF